MCRKLALSYEFPTYTKFKYMSSVCSLELESVAMHAWQQSPCTETKVICGVQFTPVVKTPFYFLKLAQYKCTIVLVLNMFLVHPYHIKKDFTTVTL